MNLNNKKIDISFIIFLTIAVIYATGNLFWWLINNPIMPMANSAIHFVDIFKKGYLFYNAPLVTWIMRGMFFVFGKEYYELIILFTNYIFFLIPLYFIYKIGEELKDKETGNIAMILFALSPAVYGMSRQYGHQDYHIIAGIIFNIYCLIKTDYFRNRKWTIWYGISVGLGLMIKDAFLAYFFVPFIYIVIVGLKDRADKTKIVNIILAIAIGSLIAGWHYFRSFIIYKILYEPISEPAPIFCFASLRVTTIGLWEELLSPPIFLVFIIGLIYFIWKYKGKYKNIILLWFFVPWTIMIFMLHGKLPEYGAGFIPAMILISAIFISDIKKVYIKKTVIILLIGVLFLQYVNFSYQIFDIGIFNINYENEKYKISYYNKNSDLIWIDKKSIQLNLKFSQYLKSNYSNKRIKIDEFVPANIDIEGILANMALNDFDCTSGQYEYEDILLGDIIIIFGTQKTVKQLVDLKNNKMFEKPVEATRITKDYEREVVKSAQLILEEMQQNYHPIDVFYLDESKNEDKKVTILARKI